MTAFVDVDLFTFFLLSLCRLTQSLGTFKRSNVQTFERLKAQGEHSASGCWWVPGVGGMSVSEGQSGFTCNLQLRSPAAHYQWAPAAHAASAGL